MKALVAIAALNLLSVAHAAEEPAPININSEDRYFLVSRSGTANKPTIVIKRVSATGTSYGKRSFDCEARTAMFLGSGDTLEAMEKAAPQSAMKPLVKDSITETLWHWACNK